VASLENRRLRMPPCLVPNDRFFLGGAGRKRQLSFFANGNNGSGALIGDRLLSGIGTSLTAGVRQFASKNTYFSLHHPSVYAGFRPHFWKCV